MDLIKLVLTLILLFIVLDIIYIAYYILHNVTLKNQTNSSSTTTINVQASQSNKSTTTTIQSTTIKYVNYSNATLNLSQVVQTLGTGWLAASQQGASNSKISLENSTAMEVPSYGTANFSNSGSYLVDSWIEFGSASEAANYAKYSFSYLFPGAIDSANIGTYNGFKYIFYSGPSINNGQAASILIANRSIYEVEIFNRGSNASISQMEELLNYQASALNLT